MVLVNSIHHLHFACVVVFFDGILALERIQAQYNYIQYVLKSLFQCPIFLFFFAVEHVDTKDYLQATPISEFFLMFSPANFKL